MNRSFRAEESLGKQRMGSLRSSIMKEKDEELGLFLEMRRREKERHDLLLLQKSEEFDASLGPTTGSSPVFNISSAAPARKTVSDDFLNSDNDKNDYDWLLTPPGTPLFPSLEMNSHNRVANNLGSPKARPTALKSRLANPTQPPPARSNLTSRQPPLSPGNSSNSGLRRSSSSGGSRSSTPTGRPTLTNSRSTLTSVARPTTNMSSKGISNLAASKSSQTSLPSSKPSRSATPTSRSVPTSTKSAVPPRSSTPNSRSTARPSTPTSRPSIPGPKSTSRASTPTRRPVTSPALMTSAPARSLSSSSVAKSSTLTASRNPVPPRASSPTVKPRPWNPSDMPGYSLDAPPNLRTSLSDRPASVTRGRPGAPSSRSSSIDPSVNGRGRRQSCSPSRGRPPNGIIHNSGSSVPVPAMSRLHAKANDSVSPVAMGNKMVERVINMRKLAPPRQDSNRHSPSSNLSAKSSSPDSTGFGRTLSKKSLDMAMRHMDIRRTIPGNLRPLMTNIPASSLYSVRSGHSRSRTLSVSDSPLATSSNASSEVSVNNNALCVDDVSSDRGGPRSPTSIRSR